MNRTWARRPLRFSFPLAASIAASLFAACAGSPNIAIVSPAPGSTLTAASDLDSTTPGLQIAVDATTSASDGSTATASGGGALAYATASGGKIHFASVTISDGTMATLVVAVVDSQHNKTAQASATYSVDSLSSGCRISTPANQANFSGDPGDTGLISVVVQAVCRGLASGVQVGLLENDDAAPSQLQTPAADGSVSFNADLIPGANLLAVVASGVRYDQVEVNLISSRCRAEIEPPSGSKFNLDGNDGAISSVGAADGLVQANVTVKSNCPQNTSARLVISNGGAVVSTLSGIIQGGSALFIVNLPQGSDDLQAFVGAPGTEGASRHATYSSDGLSPMISITSPANGDLLGAADDVGTGTQFFARITGQISGLDSGGFAALEIDQGTSQAQEVPVTPDLTTGAFSVDVALTAGVHSLSATVVRASGNTDSSSPIQFTIVFSGSALAISSPVDGATLGLSALTPSGSGIAQANILVESVGLTGAAVAVSCGTGVTGTGTIGADGKATVPVSLPIASCAGALFSCTATANSGAITSSPISFTADDTAPSATITFPTASETAASQINFEATTSCAGEGQLYTASINGTAIASGSVQGNAIQVPHGVTLSPGLNTLSVTVTDAAHNSGTAQTTITLISGTPTVVITAPANNATLTSAQSTVAVQVDNRPAGSAVQLTVSDAAGARAPLTANTVSANGHEVATFTNVALPEGAITLTASVTDPVTPPPTPTTASITVIVNTGRPLCDVVIPADGTAWTAADDSEPSVTGFQHDMSVSTNATGAVVLTVTPAGGNATSLTDNSGGSGSVRTVTFPNVALAADGNYSVSATCAGPGAGASLANAVSYFATGPVASFIAPQLGATLGEAQFDANGNTAIQVAAAGAGAGGEITLSAECNMNGLATYGPMALVNGGATFNIPLLAAGQSGTCVLTAQAQTASGVLGIPVPETVAVDRVTPTPLFIEPTAGEDFAPDAGTELDCTDTNNPKLVAVEVSVGSGVAPSGAVLSVTNSAGTQTVSQTPTLANGILTWSEVPVAAESNTLNVIATDGAGNSAAASVAFSARCASLGVVLTFAVSGTRFGYAQDKDHTTPGLQVDAQVQTGSAAVNGSAVRICSTALSSAPAGCTTPGTGAVAVVSGTPTIEHGIANFTVTLPDGPLPTNGNPTSGQETVYAEVTDVSTDVSAAKALDVRATPPTVTSLSLAEDTEGDTLNSGPDGALNQTEIDAANGTVHFQVVFGAGSAVAGQTVQIFSKTNAAALGSATVAQNGDGATATSVPVPIASLTTGAEESYVFYAQVTDDAANKNSTPGNVIAGVAPITLGTDAVPFVIAPTPTVTLTSPAAGTSQLNASNDVGCASGPCPGTDPLIYAFAATSTAQDVSTSGQHSQITFLENGVAIAPQSGESNPNQTTDGGVSGVDLPVANGSSVVLAAQLEDPYGNVATSSLTLNVDSVPPQLTISMINGTSPIANTFTVAAAQLSVLVTIDASGGEGTLESMQPVYIFSNGTQVGSAIYTGGGTVLVQNIQVVDGTYSFVAKATDLAGNAAQSSSVNVVQAYAGASIVLANPAPVPGGTLWLNPTTTCSPTLTYSTTNVPANRPLSLWVLASGGSCGAAPTSGVQSTVIDASGSTMISTAPFALVDGSAGVFCALTSDAASNPAETSQSFQCDLQTPTITWTSPSAGQTFVGNGQTQLAMTDTLSTNTDPHYLGLSSATLMIKAPTGGTLTLSIDEQNTPTTTTTSFVSCTVPALSSATAVSVLGNNDCTTDGGTGNLAAPVDFAQLLQHTLTAELTAPSGNMGSGTQSVNIDVAQPAAVTPTVSVLPVVGVVNVTIPTVPGDDQTVGGPPADWEVRYSAQSFDSAHWSGATLVNANIQGAFPTGVPTSFQVVLPTGNPTLYFGVRAKDRVGNLGDFAAANLITVDTQPTTSSIAIIDDSGAAPTVNIAVPPMRIADLNGDGYDDVILDYASTACDVNGACNGRIIVYFGGSGGIVNPTHPLVLAGSLYNGTLGNGAGFDVGNFTASTTGTHDIAAAEWGNITNDFTAPEAADVLIWRGADIAAWEAAAAAAGFTTLPAAPAPFITLAETAPLYIGGTVRAAGQVTGGSLPGDDLAISNYQIGDSSTGPFAVAVLSRGESWADGGAATVFTGSSARATIDLPDEIDSDPDAGVDGDNLEATTFTYKTAMGDRTGLVLSLVYVDTMAVYPVPAQNDYDLRLFDGDDIAMGTPPTWINAPALPTPEIGVHELFGLSLAGGKDAVGDSYQDLMIPDFDRGSLFLYDGAQLLGTEVPDAGPPATFEYTAYEPPPGTGTQRKLVQNAVLLPDLDGDGKAEISAGSDPTEGQEPAYFWFGQNGDEGAFGSTVAALPPLPFFSFPASTCVASATVFCMDPGRGQELSPSLLATPLQSGAPFGQATGAGHITSQSGYDVVILSQDFNPDGSAPGTLVLMR